MEELGKRVEKILAEKDTARRLELGLILLNLKMGFAPFTEKNIKNIQDGGVIISPPTINVDFINPDKEKITIPSKK